ncbi:helix-turn-helix transcriptional regulator [Fusibacter sp. JL216-2]|uniref:helix-turn-helix transcriptional regulator n=1 Tax=Fusibacter sp. JL216-2 TaxID=3071453 RepID=UPI003D33B13E
MSTFLADVVQIKESERALTAFIEQNRPTTIRGYVEQVDDAMYFRSNVRDQKKIVENKKFFEVATMTEADINLSGLTDTEKRVLLKRLEMRTNSFREVDKALGYKTDGSSSYQIYRKAIKKIEKYLLLPSDQKCRSLLSEQQYNIYECMKLNMTNKEIAEKLGCSLGTVKTSKNRIRKKLNPLSQLSVPVEGVNEKD